MSPSNGQVHRPVQGPPHRIVLMLERNILIKDNNKKKKKRFHNGLNHLFSIGVELCDILCMVFANLTPKTKHVSGTAP